MSKIKDSKEVAKDNPSQAPAKQPLAAPTIIKKSTRIREDF